MSSSRSRQSKPKLGQNFLVDQSACLRIAEALWDAHDRTVVEIGPGHGAITDLLATRCSRLHCLELDPALARELGFRFRLESHVTIHETDVLKTNFSSLLEPGQNSLDVVGNLPYYITSDILLHLYSAAREGVLRRAVLMMQREVADRIAAGPGSSDYGALSAFTALHGTVASLFTLPPGAFAPPPEVHSTVVRLEFAPRFTQLGVGPEPFNRFLRASFAQKRKTLANNLRVAGYGSEQIGKAWPAGLAPQVRAEAVSLEAMAEIYRRLESPTAPEADGVGSFS